MTGGGSFSIKGKISGIVCTGTANVTHTGLTCRGQRGDIFASCDDGRTLGGEWTATSCTTGIGQGMDSTGSAFAFTFGLSEDEALKEINKRLALSKNKPDLPTYNPKNSQKTRLSVGTGFFITGDGHILTNYHVIEDAKEIKVIIGKHETGATLLGKDPANDIAILKIFSSSRSLPILQSSSISKDPEVMTLGYPLINIQGQEQKQHLVVLMRYLTRGRYPILTD